MVTRGEPSHATEGCKQEDGERGKERSGGIHSSITVIYREKGVPPQVHLSGEIDRDVFALNAQAVIYVLGLVLAFFIMNFICMVAEAS